MRNKLATILATATLSLPSYALYINNYSPERHNIKNDSFFKSEYDFSGVGYNGRWVTVISDNWGVTSTHFPARGIITFPVTGDTAQIIERINLGNDISLVRFSEDLPNSIKRYNLFDDEGKMYKDWNTTYLMVGKTFSAGLRGGGQKSEYDFLNFSYSNKPDWAYGVSGDSGAPTFFQGTEDLFLMGTHYNAYMDTNLILNSQRIADITGTKITTWTNAMNPPKIPEPSTLPITLLGASVLINRRKRR